MNTGLGSGHTARMQPLVWAPGNARSGPKVFGRFGRRYKPPASTSPRTCGSRSAKACGSTEGPPYPSGPGRCAGIGPDSHRSGAEASRVLSQLIVVHELRFRIGTDAHPEALRFAILSFACVKYIPYSGHIGQAAASRRIAGTQCAANQAEADVW